MMTEIQIPFLTAVIDRIIPADDFPSASQAGVLNFLDRILTSDAHELAEPISKGLAELDAAAVQRFNQPFVDVTPEQQDALLESVERTFFFQQLVQLTSEGYYADPGNGGNLGEISWKMIGYEPREKGDVQ